MFRGSYEVTVDERGRFKLPAGFMKLVATKEYGSEFFVTSMDGQIGEIWPLPEWEAREAAWALIPDESREKQRFLEQVNYYGQQVELDGQGRLIVPQRLRGTARLLGDVDILGTGKYMKIANHETMMQRVEADGRGLEESQPVKLSAAMDYMAAQGKLAKS